MSNIIQTIKLENLTVFNRFEYRPSPGINVVLGTNGSGKSHLLKLLYALHSFSVNLRESDTENKQRYAERLSETITRNFLVSTVGRLSSRVQGHKHSRVTLDFNLSGQPPLEFEFSTRSSFVDIETATRLPLQHAVFIPPREMLGMYEGFLAAYRLGHIKIEEHYADLAAHLGVKGSPGKLPAELQKYTEAMEGILDARVEFDTATETFYIRQSGRGRIEVGLAADGHKKLGTIMHLVKTGSLRSGQTVLIDEPETNMNPSASRPLVKLVFELAKNGNQVFVATHDYFFLKYMEILRKDCSGVPVTFLNLFRDTKTNKFVEYEVADSLYALEHNRVFEEFEAIHKETMSGFWDE